MVNQVSIRFFLRTDQLLETGKVPIYVRVILDREKYDFSSRQYVNHLSEWDEVTQRVKRKTPINSALAEIEHDVNEAYNFLKYHNKPLTIYALKRQLKGEKNVKLRIVEFVDDYFEAYVERNSEYASATKQTYTSTINHLKKFMQVTGKSRMLISEVDVDFIK